MQGPCADETIPFHRLSCTIAMKIKPKVPSNWILAFPETVLSKLCHLFVLSQTVQEFKEKHIEREYSIRKI